MTFVDGATGTLQRPLATPPICLNLLYLSPLEFPATSIMLTASNSCNVNSDHCTVVNLTWIKTRNSSGDEIANVNLLYDDIVHALRIQ